MSENAAATLSQHYDVYVPPREYVPASRIPIEEFRELVMYGTWSLGEVADHFNTSRRIANQLATRLGLVFRAPDFRQLRSRDIDDTEFRTLACTYKLTVNDIADHYNVLRGVILGKGYRLKVSFCGGKRPSVDNKGRMRGYRRRTPEELLKAKAERRLRAEAGDIAPKPRRKRAPAVRTDDHVVKRRVRPSRIYRPRLAHIERQDRDIEIISLDHPDAWNIYHLEPEQHRPAIAPIDRKAIERFREGIRDARAKLARPVLPPPAPVEATVDFDELVDENGQLDLFSPSIYREAVAEVRDVPVVKSVDEYHRVVALFGDEPVPLDRCRTPIEGRGASMKICGAPVVSKTYSMCKDCAETLTFRSKANAAGSQREIKFSPRLRYFNG